ncbi:hypothetical protein IH992_24400 [Candidatus Poribacteria bacterium]|nr:hypothetical protein [Candidatus Poribacteria bacterium]
MAGTKHRDWFPAYLHDYRVTIETIIPACVQSQDEGLVDEIHHALDIRSELEEELKKRPQLEKYRREIKSVDKALLAQRETLLKITGEGLPHYRKVCSRPQSHWWWYLDELEKDGDGR